MPPDHLLARDALEPVRCGPAPVRPTWLGRDGRERSRRLLVIADSAIPVPPSGYGGTERVLGYLLDGMAARGYHITLMGARGSRPPGRLVAFSDARGRHRLARGAAKASFWARLAFELPRHDLVHSVARLDYVLPALRHAIPKVLHFHTALLQDQVAFVRRYARGRVVMSAPGARMMEAVRDGGCWRPVHNGIPTGRYPFSAAPADPPYVLFLGKLLAGKGAHVAIEVAARAGVRLVIAGNVGDTGEDRAYFDRQIRPHLRDGVVDYVGEQGDEGKTRLLGGARALLLPTSLEETFGLVAIEALACGTPVITTPRGELPLIVREGITGFVCATVDEMVDAVGRVDVLNRARCRADARSRFDVAAMVGKFDEVYGWLLGGQQAVPAAWSRP